MFTIQSHAHYVTLNRRLRHARRSCVLFFSGLTLFSIYTAWSWHSLPTTIKVLFVLTTLIHLSGTFLTAFIEKRLVTTLRAYESTLIQMYVVEHHRHPDGATLLDALIYGLVFERPTPTMVFFTRRPNTLHRFVGNIESVEAMTRWRDDADNSVAISHQALATLWEMVKDDPPDTIYTLVEDWDSQTFKLFDRMPLQQWRETRQLAAETHRHESAILHHFDRETLERTSRLHKDPACTTPSTSPTDSSGSATSTIIL